jgi:hypothetical protein
MHFTLSELWAHTGLIPRVLIVASLLSAVSALLYGVGWLAYKLVGPPRGRG